MSYARPPDELDAYFDGERVELVKKWTLGEGAEVDEADVRLSAGSLGKLFEMVDYELDEDELTITISDAEIPRQDAIRIISGDLLDVLADEDPEVVRQVVANLGLDETAGGARLGFQ